MSALRLHKLHFRHSRYTYQRMELNWTTGNFRNFKISFVQAMDSSNSISDLQSCLNRIRAGDQASCNELFQRVATRFEVLARQMLAGYPMARVEADTGDLIQMALVRLLRMLNEFVPETPVDLMRLAALQMRRELIDLSRRMRNGPLKTPPTVDDSAGQDQQGLSTLNPARLAEWTEFHEHAANLPVELRAVFDLLWYQEVSQSEAASILEVSERTIQRRWRLARLSLQQSLESKLKRQ